MLLDTCVVATLNLHCQTLRFFEIAVVATSDAFRRFDLIGYFGSRPARHNDSLSFVSFQVLSSLLEFALELPLHQARKANPWANST